MNGAFVHIGLARRLPSVTTLSHSNDGFSGVGHALSDTTP
jgi:hypothetical protein